MLERGQRLLRGGKGKAREKEEPEKKIDTLAVKGERLKWANCTTCGHVHNSLVPICDDFFASVFRAFL